MPLTRENVPAPATRAPVRHKPARQLVDEALRSLPAPPETPSWSHRLLPPTLRGVLADLGMWHNPTPQPPSTHLDQTLTLLRRYGWCQSLDTTVTGRLCLRGAMNVLVKTGHATPQARDQAVHYLQTTLRQAGITMQYFAWNDLPDQRFSAIETLLTSASRTARKNGE